MQHIAWDTIPEPARQFLRSLALPNDGAIIEQDGRPSFRVIAYPQPAAPSDDPPWTAADNQRRCELIDREIDGVLTPDERLLLESLQGRLRRFVNTVAPLPLDPLRKLHQELLEKATTTESSA